MSEIKYYIIDIETNGLRLKHHELTEVSFIRVDDKMIFSKQVKCDYPNRASLDALKITGKTIQDLYYGEKKNDVVAMIKNFLNKDNLTPEHRCIIGHNVNFDRSHLLALFDEFNETFPANLWLDTMGMMRQIIKQANPGIKRPKINLEASCQFFKLEKTASFHNAKGDAKNTFYLWQKIQAINFDYLPYIKRLPHKEEVIATEENLSDLYD